MQLNTYILGGIDMLKTVKRSLITIIAAIVVFTITACSDGLNEAELTIYRENGYDIVDGRLEKDIYEPTYELVSLVASKDINGKTFLTFGSIDSEPVYYFYYKTEDGGYKVGSIPADSDRTTVFYIEDGETPHIDVAERISVVHEDGHLSYDHYTKNWIKYNVYVPNGSIAQDFQMNIQ